MPALITLDHYVPTDEIKKAVRGRETDVLDKLSIPWQDGRPHLHCPYPDHPDRHPSWRWDTGGACAMCTCSTSDSIFDVVMKMKGVDFAAAKVWIAEALDRTDLICQPNEKHHLRHDAVSLLNPPDHVRDDRLPFIYLAARLGVDREEVPRPTTPVAGYKELEYFDPPTRQSGKPKLIGAYPCAAFGTVSADGRNHAQRIYLAPDGRGKAELGEIRPGERRNPKKSARLVDGQPSPAGCAVIWGDPTRAPHIILTEGVETGAAVAYALRGEIESNRAVVASAITAGGIESFEPWPATTSVTVAADSDESKAGAGYRRGETAARKFALRNHRNIAVGIAMPGELGESADWLDILRRDAVAAVRSGIRKALPFEATPEEIAAAESSSARDRKLKAVSQEYPVPSMSTAMLRYRYTQHDEIWLHKYEPDKNDPGERSGTWKAVASPIGVLALLQRADDDNADWMRVVVEDMTGKPRFVDFDRNELGKLSASEVRASLFGAGLRVEGDGESICVQMLKAAKPGTCVKIVSRPGWHRLPEISDQLFVTPAGEIIGSPGEVTVELAASIRLGAGFSRCGTLEGWRDAVRAAVLAENCAHWVLSIAAGFAGVIIDLTGLGSCGLHLSGVTSLGKSTGQRLSVSPWASPKLSDDGLFRSWRTTGNAFEVHARNSSGTILPLDEMAHVDGATVGRSLYALAGGVGKARMGQNTTLQPSYTWSTFVLLSGEKTLEQKIRGDGGQWTGGMAVRFPDIDVSEVNSRVPAETIDAIDQIAQHYGHAGPAFVTALIAAGLHRQPDSLRGRVLAMARNLAGDEADSPKIRAAIPFAVVSIAGALAQQFEVIPVEADIAGAVRGAWGQFISSSDALALDPEEQAIANIQRFVKQAWDVTIRDTTGCALINREAEGWYDTDAVYLPKETLTKAVRGLLSEAQVARLLDRRDYLAKRGDRNRIATRYVPKVGHIDCYALKRSVFGRTDAITKLYAVGNDG
jgi:hypothetical protein